MSNESFAEIRARVVELLIVSAERLEVFPVVKYSAMWLFADRLCNTLSDSRQESGEDIDHWLLRPLTESSLQLFALISLWISSKMHTSRPVSVKSLKSLGDKMINDQHFTTRDYVEAEVVFMQVLGFEISMMNTPFAHLEDLHHQFIEISKIGEMVNFEVCMDIMDLVYEKGTRYSDPVIFAASILIASYLITVPKQRHEFPLLQWVVFIASFREDDVLELVEDILKIVLHPSNNISYNQEIQHGAQSMLIFRVLAVEAYEVPCVGGSKVVLSAGIVHVLPVTGSTLRPNWSTEFAEILTLSDIGTVTMTFLKPLHWNLLPLSRKLDLGNGNGSDADYPTARERVVFYARMSYAKNPYLRESGGEICRKMLALGCSVPSSHMGISFTPLLRELEQIWTDIGETQAEKDRMLLELEKECLEIYRKKVDEAANTKARLHQSVAAKEAELATLLASLGELKINSLIPSEKKASSLKEKLAAVSPILEDLRAERDERKKQFTCIKEQLDKISEEISGYNNSSSNLTATDYHEEDLSLRKLTEYQNQLRTLQKEKADRVSKILEYVNEVHSLCAVLGIDFGKTVSDVHPSLHANSLEQSTNIGNNVLEGLEQAINKLKIERKSRYLKLKNLASALSELWNLMDSPYEEKIIFADLTFVAGSSETEISQPGLLTTDIIEQASEEVERLKTLKASRMKQLVMNKRSELEEICRVNHMEPDTSTTTEKVCALIDAGLVDPSELLSSIESQIAKANKEAASRQDIMDRIGRWLSACEEEIWLDDYNQDVNRYSAGRGAHINLKRAERARVTVSKIPTILDNLIVKTLAWEKEKRVMFLYDGVRLLSILDEYKLTRKRKEEAKRRCRDQKKLQDLLVTEKEAMYGSRPSPRRSTSFRKPSGYPNGNGSMTPTPRRSSIGSPTPELQTPRSYSGRQNGYFSETRRMSTGPLNFGNIRKEDTLSCTSTSFCDSESSSQI